MPQIPPTVHPVLTILQAIAFLQNPADAAQRETFLSEMAGIGLAQTFARDLLDPSALTREQKRAIANAPSPAAFLKAIDEESDSYSRDLGEIFITVLAMAEHKPALSSLNKAIEIQIRRRVIRGKSKISRDHLMRKWSERKPVSHFLAALRMGIMLELGAIYGIKDISRDNSAPDISELINRIEQIKFDDPTVGLRFINWLVDFASIAEELRRRAGRAFAQGQRHPLLTDDDAWFFGPDVPLPIPAFCMCRPAPDEVDYLLT